jgi:hypothetical protein
LRGCIDGTQASLFGTHVSSFTGFGNGFMGAEVDNPNGGKSPISARTQSSYSNSWFCVVCGGGPVGVSVNEFVPVQVVLSISGHATNITDASFISLSATLDLSNGTSLQFNYAQDGTDPPGATLDLGAGSIPVTLTQDPVTGDWSFSVDESMTTLLCGPNFPCQPADSPCLVTDSCNATPSFSDTQSISLLYDGEGNPFSLDALDPFEIKFVSLDPNFVFASSDGQSSGPQPAAVPEPGSLALMLAVLLGVTFWSRRASTSRD